MTIAGAQADAAAHRPFRLANPSGDPRLVIICDHASNRIPPALGTLGLDPADLLSHIAWDIGAAGVAEIVARQFNAPAVLCGTSRLVIDCNRYPDDPRAIPEVSDGVAVPGNTAIAPAARRERIARYFRPYHAEVARVIDAAIVAGSRPILLSIHSMTPEMAGRYRPWQIAVSSGADRRLADPMLAALRRVAGITVGDNEPYDMDPTEDYSIPEHALTRGLLHLQIEFRQDEVATPEGQARWAGIFAAAMEQVLAAPRG